MHVYSIIYAQLFRINTEHQNDKYKNTETEK